MGPDQRIDRAKFLRLSAITAVTTVVAACAPPPSPSTPAPAAPAAPAPAAPAAPAAAVATATSAPVATATPAPVATSVVIAKVTEVSTTASKYKEAPMLADMVKAGTLPPVDQRLPAKPYVVPHPWLTTGTYGGMLQMAHSDKSDWGTGHYIQESMYGHSLLRWLKDGLEIGPGLVESWEANTDLSEFTLHFRQGMKWSDGKPWSVDDVMFWWQDEVQTPDLKEDPPDEARSGKGTLFTLNKVDDNTLKLTYDAPAPLTIDRLAMWVKRGIGPRWMDPKHYLQQFHPKYNTSVDATKWVDDFILKRDFARNPACPTMTGWMLKQYNQGTSSIWTRNPYYWCVDKDGNQLPYIDGITQTNFQDPQVMRLRMTSGQVDYVHGGHTPLTLADVSPLKAAQPTSKLEVRFWDDGGGTGQAWFFSYDYIDPKYRALFRTPKFVQALSHAMNRAEIQKSVYYETGELTTGTMSPKALEFHVAGGAEVYTQWRDSYIKYDPELAKSMLDALGIKDKGGKRTFPDGSPLKLTLDYHADADPNGNAVKMDTIVAKNWQAIGIDVALNPVTPTSWDDTWAAGTRMTNADWGVGDGPNCLVYPQWLVPLEPTRWSPLEGKMYALKGTPKENTEANVDPYKRQPPRMAPDKGGVVEKLWNLYDQTKVEVDQLKRTQLVWQIIKLHISDGPFFVGTAANTPTIVLVKDGLKNVPTYDDLGPQNGYQHGFTGPWIIPSPAVYDPETYYWTDPTQHMT
ncbi:MAG TPA: ABC transporter substrate-binding protein [Chloroflexota bacterium]|nr:ABC transporter substrate-binding protein [Chloroflexota bacterium]